MTAATATVMDNNGLNPRDDRQAPASAAQRREVRGADRERKPHLRRSLRRHPCVCERRDGDGRAGDGALRTDGPRDRQRQPPQPAARECDAEPSRAGAHAGRSATISTPIRKSAWTGTIGWWARIPTRWTETSFRASYADGKDFRLPTTAPGRLSFAEGNSSVHPEEQPEGGHHLASPGAARHPVPQLRRGLRTGGRG